MITLILLSILFSSQLQYSIVKDFCFCSLYRQKHYEDSIMKHLLLSCFIRKVLWRFDSWRFCPWGGDLRPFTCLGIYTAAYRCRYTMTMTWRDANNHCTPRPAHSSTSLSRHGVFTVAWRATLTPLTSARPFAHLLRDPNEWLRNTWLTIRF